MPVAPAGSATASAQIIQAADDAVSVQLSLLHQLYWHNFSIIVVDQTARLGASALVINDTAPVSRVEEHRSILPYNPSVSCFQPCLPAFANDHWNQHSGSAVFSDAQNVLITGSTFVSLPCRLYKKTGNNCIG